MRRTAMMILGLVLAATSAMAAPDLSCAILVEQVTDVSGPEPVKKVQVTVSVTNLGDSGATNTGNVDPILVFRDLPDAPTSSDVPDAFFPLTSLAPGAEVNFDLEEVSMVPGSYKAWCWVNPVIPGADPPIKDELNFDDNIVSKPYIVTPPPIAAPDLVITSLETTAVGPYEYDFSIVVDNVGGAASGPFQVDIFPDEEAEPNWSTPGLFSEVFCASDGLSAQSSEVLSCTPIYTGWTPLDVGTQTVYAYVDIGGEVGDESDISNNSFSTDVEVKAPAELSTLFFAVDSEAGDVTYDVTVGNAGGENATGVSIGLVYQSNFPPNSCDDADDVKVVPFIQAAGSTLVQFERTGAIGGEGFKAWVIVDCDDTVLEGGEGDNIASFTYDVDGVPNVPPEFGEIEAPPDCRETEACYWNVEVIDETIAGADVAIRVVDGPAGMWGDSANQRIVYVPPLESTAVNADFTVVLDDGLGGTAEQVLQVDVEPRTDFRGLVGQKGALPTDVGNQCALFEIPGTGFLWVDREDYAVRLVRSEEGDQTPLADVSPHLTIPVAIDHNVESPFLSCHVAMAPNGGFFLLETTTQVLLQYGANGTFIRKIALEGVSSGVEVFVPFAESTYVFFDTIQDFPFPALYFIDVSTGTLDTDYGAPLEDAEEGDPKSGKIPLAIVTPADWSSEYLWIGPDRIRLLNRQFSALGFVDLSFTGEVIAETLFEDTPIDGIVPTNPELYLPMAAPDGGLMLQDFSTATLRWYQADYSPRYGFSLAAPGGETEPGVVSLQAYGYSVDNIRCDLLPAGGWTCHDFTSQRGFVVDEFGDLYDYCPKVSVSPTSIEFGGITAFETSEKTVTVVNAGSGVFAVESVSLSEVFGEFSAITPAAFPTSPYLLAPGSSIALDFEYTPTGPGEAGLIFNINAVADDPLCPASKISIPVTGYSGARLQATPGLISFNGVGPGLHNQKVTIQSVGSTSLQLNSVSLADNTKFQLSPSNIPNVVLSPGDTIEFDVLFDGTIEGEFTTSLNIGSNDATNPNAQIPVTARTGPRLELEPPGLKFGGVSVGESLARAITITNVGETTINFEPPSLTGIPSFSLEADGFVPTLAKGESTTLSVRYSPTAPGTQIAKVLIQHDSDAIPTVEFIAVAGTGTELPLGFDGVLSFADTYGPIAMTGGAIELDTGGFAAWGSQAGAIYTLNGSGEPISVLGLGGVIQMSGPEGAFPNATALGATLLELESGDFAMLSPADGRIYVVRPDGLPNPHIGDNGVIDVFAAGDGIGSLASVMAQLNDGPARSSLLVFETIDEQLIAIGLDGDLAPAFGSLGRVNFSAPGAVVGAGAALETGNNLAVRGTGDIIFSDTITEKFYRLTEIGNAVPGTGTAVSYTGVLEAWRTPFETAYYDPAIGTLQVFEDAFTSYVFDNGQTSLDVAAVWPAEILGPALIVLNDSGVAVSTQLNDRLVFVSEDGAPMSLLPSISVFLPDAHDFGDVAVGDVSEPIDIVVNNNGTYVLTVSPVFSNGLFQLLGGSESVDVAPGASATLEVVYAPMSKGQHQSTLDIATNDPLQPLVGSAQLTGATGPDLVLNPPPLIVDFGNVAVGESAKVVLTLQNQGVADVNVELPVVGPAPFALGDKVVNGVLVPGAAPSELEVVFSPTSQGTFVGLATIVHTDTTKPSYVLQLVGRSGPELQVTPTSVSCIGSLGGLTSCGALTVKNIGTAEVSIFGVATDNLSFEATQGPVVLQPGASLVDSAGIPSLQLYYQGLSPEPQSGTLTILHSDLSVGGVTTISLSGAIPGNIQASPATVAFGPVPDGVIVTKTVTLSGLGQVLSATATGAAEFSVGSLPSLPAEVTGGSIDIPVRCAPTGAGRFTGTLVIATNAAGGKLIEVPMSCESGALLAATPAVVDFGGVPTGQTKTRIIGLKNVGIESVTILSALTNGTGFSGSGLSEPLVLAPNESFALDAVFSPQQAGVSVGTMTIQPSGAPPTIVPLTGVTGPSVSVNVPNDPIDFGVQGVGSTSKLPVIVTNTGTSAASFGGASVSAAPFSVESVPEIGPIAPGEQVVFFVRFSPPVIGNYGATLTVITDGQTTEVSVTGKTGGALVVAPETLDFGNVPLGQAAELPLGVSNISPDTSVEVRVLQGGDIAAFTLIGLSDGDTLPANASLNGVKIQFNPTTERDYQSVFTFTTNDGVEDQAYTLIATARSGAQLSLLHPRAAFHAFESVPIGTSRSLPLRIAAPGGSAASVLGYTLDGDGTSEFQFSLSGLGSVPVTLQSESVLDLDVTCSPQQAGVYTATLNLATDMPSMPVIPVKLWCSTPASITAAPKRVEFDAVALLTPTDKTVTFTNVGPSPVLLTSATVSTTTPAALELTNPLLGNTVIEVGASHDFNVRLTPDTAGDFEGELVVSSTDAVSPTLSIPITGFSGPRVQASTEAVLFCSADTETIALTNTGTSTTAVESVELTSSDASLQVTVVDGSGQPLTGPYFLEPQESFELQVAWSGVLSGADEAAGSITVVSDDPRGNRTIALVAGRGWVVPNEFNGVADLGEPGTPAFPGATGLGLAGAELCTGGGIYGSHIDQALYAARPSALGAATPSTVWGLDGVIDLQQVRSSRPDITAALDDLGADISVFDGGDLIAVGAPATGHWLLVRPNGELASSHPSGGVLSLSKALSARAIAGGLDRRDTDGFVSVDRLTRAVIGIQSNSLLDTDFGASGVITLGNVFPEFDVSGTVGESVQTLANGSVAITDGATAQIFIVRPDGTPDTTLGASNSGVLTLNAGFQPDVTSIGGIVRFGAGFTAVEPARNSLLFIGAGGGPIPGALGGATDNGRLRIIGNSGAFPAAGRLAPIIYQTTEDAVASPANAGKWMLFDAGFNDILVLDENGSGFESGLPELQADCPVNIQQGQTGAIQLTNTGQATLSLTDAEVSSEDLACVGCAGVAIVPGDSASINLQWTVPEGAQGCFTEQLTLIHDGVNNPTYCPVQLGTNAAFQVVPGSDTAYQYVFPPVSSGGAVTRDLVIRNAGCTPFTLQSLVLSGDNVFTVPPVPVDGVELAFGDVYVASVTCAPDAGGQYDGTLIFGATSNVTTQPLQLFCTSGPYLERSASSLDWGSQALGTGGSRTLSLTSSGGAPVHLIAVEPDGAVFNIENQAGTPEGTFELLTIPSVASPLAVGLSFDLTVIFTPPDHGEYAAELVIGANSFDAVSEEVRIPLTGTSTAEAVFVPASLDFGIVGVGAEACQAVDIQNNGAVNLSIQLQQASLDGTAFRFEGNPVVPNILPFNANTKTVELCCAPDEAGVFTTSLDIALDGAASELTQYDLTCRGESCFTREDSTGLDFGEVRWDETSTSTIAMTADIGSQTLDVEVSGAGAEQVIVGPPVLIDGVVEIAVTFDPSGDFVPLDAVLTVTSELCSSELAIPVTGTVIPPEAAAVDGDAEADSADSVDSSDDTADGTDATAAVDEADGVDDTSDGTDAIDSSDVVEASGVDDGCGCDMTPKQKPFPTGPATALVLVSLLLIRARIRE